jgi:hypothetical protein
LRTSTTGVGDKQDVKDRELTQVQIYKFFTFVQKKNDYFTNFIIFIKHLEGSRGRTLRLSYLASRARTHAKRARTRTACRQSHPRGPLTPLQTSPVTRRCASHRYLYRVFMGATVNRRLRASGLRPQPWHLIEVLNATCGACLLSLKQKKKPRLRLEVGASKRKTGLVILYTASIRHLKT